MDKQGNDETSIDKSNYIGVEWSNVLLQDEIKDEKYDCKVIIRDIRTNSKQLKIHNCRFEKLSLKNKNQSELKCFEINDCSMETLHIFESNTKIFLKNCDIKLLIIEKSNCPIIKLEDSSVDIISLKKGSVFSKIVISNGCFVEKLDSKDADITSIKIHNSTINKMKVRHDIKEILLEEGAALERFSIGDKWDLADFLKHLRKTRRSFSKGSYQKKVLEVRHQKQIVLAAVNQYEEEHKYQELDMCLFVFRKLDCEIKMLQSKNIVHRARYMLQDFVLGKMFGWGVRISNTLLTAMTVLIGFAALYFYHLYIKVETKPNLWSALFQAVEISVNRFFNVGSTEQILPRFDTIEQIVGVVFLTIITGVLTRKIIK